MLTLSTRTLPFDFTPVQMFPLLPPNVHLTQHTSTMKATSESSPYVDIRLKSPFTALVAGPTGSGKTRLLIQLMELSQQICYPPPKDIIYCYAEWQDAFERVGGVTFHKGLINVDDIPSDGHNRWLIVDDLMDEVSGTSEGNTLFTKKSHHKRLDVFFVVQNLFAPKIRTMSLNSHYMFLFKNPRDSSSILHLAKQVYPQNVQFLRQAYADATKRPYSYLLVDLKQATDERVRFLGNYPPSPNNPMVAYIPNR